MKMLSLILLLMGWNMHPTLGEQSRGSIGIPFGATCLAALGFFTCNQYLVEPIDVPPANFDVVASDTVALPVDSSTFIMLDRPDSNLHSVGQHWVQDGASYRRSFLKWDQLALDSAVGPNTVTAAYLEITTDSTTHFGTKGQYIGAFRMTKNWTEKGATWNCAHDSNVQNNTTDCRGATAWTQGDPASAHPWDSIPTDSALFVTPMDEVTVRFDVTADVQAFLAGSETNHGWVLSLVDGQAGRMRFHSKGGLEPPKLVLEHGQDQQAQVPSSPPDSVPQFIQADSNLIQDPNSTLRWARNVIMLDFQFEATQTEKEAAVSAVDGIVIGGWLFSVSSGQGTYLVQISHDGTDGPLWQAIALLKQLPQVWAATPFFIFDIGLN